MPRLRLLVVVMGAICLVYSCVGLPSAPSPPARPLWSTPVYERLLGLLDGAKGLPFESIKVLLNDRIMREPIFPPATENIRSDERFLLSPRNTAVRPSAWDRTFAWNWADGGSNYILYAYSKDEEVFTRRMGDARRAAVSEHDAPFVPGVIYSWDVSLCVERCNLHLSAKPALRPTFVILSAAEEAAVDSYLAAVAAWCEGAGIAGSEEGTAITALVLETEHLLSEEQQLLVKELKKHPGSVLLHLVYSGALSTMNSPYGAREEYEKARDLFEKEAGIPKPADPSTAPTNDE